MFRVILLLLVLIGCAAPAKEKMRPSTTQARQMLHDYFDAIRERGLLAEFEFLDSSGQRLTSHLIETGILVRRNDGWKLFQGHTSLISD